MIRDFMKEAPSVQEGLEGYQKNFLEGKVFSGPFADYSLSFWEHKDDDNVLLIYYEDMKKDHEGHVRRIGRFLGRELTDEQVEGIVAHTTFDAMKKNDAVSYKRYTDNTSISFINKGQVGNWVSKFTPEMSERYDREIADKCAAKGLVWKY
ncbi:PREDICTED: sulfotransferase 1C4-like [Priapulus caudatus]|uniref:Sulfotransferase 1C4-like n=1 Tax=Priapulus caudatus TaxID=37621 RepID=A0ABM1F4N0_PRICU|nr:PREDICTED: sulfotransferase 1C4-like [Priapulus caudatus]